MRLYRKVNHNLNKRHSLNWQNPTSNNDYSTLVNVKLMGRVNPDNLSRFLFANFQPVATDSVAAGSLLIGQPKNMTGLWFTMIFSDRPDTIVWKDSSVIEISIGQTDKAVMAGQVYLHHVVQNIDIQGPYTVPPFM